VPRHAGARRGGSDGFQKVPAILHVPCSGSWFVVRGVNGGMTNHHPPTTN
jgi:hypothetical protein